MSDQTPSIHTVDRVNTQLSGKAQEYHDLGHPVQHDSAHIMLFKDHQPIQAELADHVLAGKATATHTYRAYKNTPHSPIAMLGKYIVHRVNNVESYDDPAKAAQLDHKFMALHKRGKAAEKNGHVSIQDLHMLMAGNPSLVRDMVSVRDRFQGWVKNGSGLTVKDIGGEAHVALTRGLHAHVMGKEHSLASFSDKAHSGFGSVQHHVWVPVKDLWFSFMSGPEETRGQFGHENEVLASNTGTRYQAEKGDVTKSIFSSLPPELFAPGKEEGVSAALSSASPERAVAALSDPATAPHVLEYLRGRQNIPAPVARAIFNITKDPVDIVASPEIPDEEASKWLSDEALVKPYMLQLREKAAQNPNLSTASLVKAAQSQWILKDSRFANQVVDALLEHPNASPDVAKALSVAATKSDDWTFGAHVLSKIMESPHATKQTGDLILAGLNPDGQRTPITDLRNTLRSSAWGAIQTFKGTKKNDLINTDFTDKLLASNLEEFGKPNSFVTRSFPLSDTAVRNAVDGKYGPIDPLSIDENPFLTPRQVEILGNTPETLQRIAFDGRSPQIKSLAREALFRLSPDRIIGGILNHIDGRIKDDEPDELSDSELAKLGGMVRLNSDYVPVMVRFISAIPSTRLTAWKNLLEKPDSADKLAAAIREGRPLSTVPIKDEDRRIATAIAHRIIAASEGLEEDPAEHLVVPLPRV